ncbi:FAD binding domain-containing protein [Alkaliphilus serpentinus]|uniref:Xanthine dehydrogenase family protein subunit M n=1 Tax=Alkaliphilus serpentinus TaxID=1482731 RepID=A0A833MAF5_9FIRM|nr:xanthine dehydrogenase family protein subunit M [Alkaliphilus serpentinus]KAB3532086.1 xanthine dehydrogenase family protein subunit M [Alkaliphilus serpentinus]
MKDFLYYKPKTIEEACEILTRYNGEASILNGGTDVIVRIHDGLNHPKALVDIKGISGLKTISFSKEDGLVLGACANMNAVINHKDILENYQIIAEAAHTVGSCQVRNRATIIGNITNASPLADTATPLLALDAVVEVFGVEGPREISINDFFVFVRRTSLKVGDVVTAVKVPYYKELKGSYQKHSRRDAVDLATVCASVLMVDGEIKIALGSVAPTPIRCRKAEDFLRGKKLTEELIKEATHRALEEVSPISDVRATKEYREEIARVLVSRGLRDLMG